MFAYYAVDGRLPSGRKFRGVVSARGDGVVERGPDVLAGKPWHKRALTIPELQKFARVTPCKRPILTSTIKAQLEHKFLMEEDMTWIGKRGRFLQLAQDVITKMERANG